MEDLIEAIKSNDLVAVKKAFAPLIAEKTSELIEARKIEIAQSVMIEGEEADDDDEDDDKDDKDDKSDKGDKPGKDDKSDDDKDEDDDKEEK